MHLPKEAAWLAEYLHELTAFPNGKHDDQVDSTAQMLDWINQVSSGPTSNAGIWHLYKQRYEAQQAGLHTARPEPLSVMAKRLGLLRACIKPGRANRRHTLLLRRVDMMVMLENRLDALVRLHTAQPPAKIGGANHPFGGRNNLSPESFYGPNAGLIEVLIPGRICDDRLRPGFRTHPNGMRCVSVLPDTPTTIPKTGLPFTQVCRAGPGREDVLLQIASAYDSRLQTAYSAARLRRVAGVR